MSFSERRGTVQLVAAPYPAELEQRGEISGRKIVVRPIRPGDMAQYTRFLAQITTEDLRTRFFAAMREIPQSELAYVTRVDYRREMAFIAVTAGEGGRDETLAVARACTDANNVEAEFAVLVRSDLKGQGFGALLLERLIGFCRARGTLRMTGQALCGNTRMLHLAKHLGFRVQWRDGGLVEMTLPLRNYRKRRDGSTRRHGTH